MTVFRAGNVVRVLKPVFVWRVGYPMRIQDYLPEVQVAHKSELDMLLSAYSCGAEKVRERMEWELAWLRGNKEGWGGRERTLHEVTVGVAGRYLVIDQMLIKQTGVYAQARNVGTWETPEWAGPGLVCRDVHRLAQVSEAVRAVNGAWIRGRPLYYSPDYELMNTGFNSLKKHGKEYLLAIETKHIALVKESYKGD